MLTCWGGLVVVFVFVFLIPLTLFVTRLYDTTRVRTEPYQPSLFMKWANTLCTLGCFSSQFHLAEGKNPFKIFHFEKKTFVLFFSLYPYIILTFFFLLFFFLLIFLQWHTTNPTEQYYDMLRCRGVSCKVKYILDAEKSTIIYMIISVHPVTLAYVFFSISFLFLFRPPVVVFSDRPAVSSEMTSTLFVSWRHRVCLTEVQRSSSCPVPLRHPFSAAVLFDI